MLIIREITILMDFLLNYEFKCLMNYTLSLMRLVRLWQTTKSSFPKISSLSKSKYLVSIKINETTVHSKHHPIIWQII